MLTFLPNPFTVGEFFCGGEKVMFWSGLFTETNSLNSRIMLLALKLVFPFSGVADSRTGGSVSFGPPCGPDPLFAQDCKARKKIIQPNSSIVYLLNKFNYSEIFLNKFFILTCSLMMLYRSAIATRSCFIVSL